MKRKNKFRIKVTALCLWITMILLVSGCGKQGNSQPIHCGISINCETILSNMDKLKEGKEKYVPADGWLLTERTIELADGSSVFDLLRTACQEAGIAMEFSESPVYKTAYIEGIGQLYELDCGGTSGWMYRVNGEYPNYGASKCMLAEGDQVELIYTCDLGADVGKEISR